MNSSEIMDKNLIKYTLGKIKKQWYKRQKWQLLMGHQKVAMPANQIFFIYGPQNTSSIGVYAENFKTPLLNCLKLPKTSCRLFWTQLSKLYWGQGVERSQQSFQKFGIQTRRVCVGGGLLWQCSKVSHIFLENIPYLFSVQHFEKPKTGDANANYQNKSPPPRHPPFPSSDKQQGQMLLESSLVTTERDDHKCKSYLTSLDTVSCSSLFDPRLTMKGGSLAPSCWETTLKVENIDQINTTCPSRADSFISFDDIIIKVGFLKKKHQLNDCNTWCLY